MKDKVVYLKIPQNILVENRRVKIGDIATITCTDITMENHIKSIQVYVFDGDKKIQKEVFSVLKIIELIHGEFPEAEIDNEGETDFIIEYERDSKKSQIAENVKVAGVSVAVFFGAAFTIMSFNNDISVNDLFEKLYYQVMGLRSDGMTELEFFYCVGLAIGITAFFNHIGKRKLSEDPTPIQVQMRKYEKDIYTTYINNAARGGKEQDVE